MRVGVSIFILVLFSICVVAQPPPPPPTPESPSDIGQETCADGIQNQNETGVDCGGECESCPQLAQNATNTTNTTDPAPATTTPSRSDSNSNDQDDDSSDSSGESAESEASSTTTPTPSPSSSGGSGSSSSSSGSTEPESQTGTVEDTQPSAVQPSEQSPDDVLAQQDAQEDPQLAIDASVQGKTNLWWIVGVGLLVGAILAIVVVAMRKPTPQSSSPQVDALKTAVQKHLANGVSKEELIRQLENKGWPSDLIQQAFEK